MGAASGRGKWKREKGAREEKEGRKVTCEMCDLCDVLYSCTALCKK
jgi:hypothetical protein